LTVEFAVVVGTMFVLLVSSAYSSVRRRAMDAGMLVPRPQRFEHRRWFVGLGVLLLVAAVTYISLWEFGMFRPGRGIYEQGDEAIFGYISSLCTPFLLFLLGWIAWEIRRLYKLGQPLAHFRRTLFRSIVPVLGSAVILLGTLCGAALTHVEAAALRDTPIVSMLPAEVEKSNFRLLQERFMEQHQTLLAEFQQAVPER